MKVFILKKLGFEKLVLFQAYFQVLFLRLSDLIYFSFLYEMKKAILTKGASVELQDTRVLKNFYSRTDVLYVFETID